MAPSQMCQLPMMQRVLLLNLVTICTLLFLFGLIWTQNYLKGGLVVSGDFGSTEVGGAS